MAEALRTKTDVGELLKDAALFRKSKIQSFESIRVRRSLSLNLLPVKPASSGIRAFGFGFALNFLHL